MEPRTLIIESEVDLDGTTAFTQSLDDFTRVGRSLYLLELTEPFGTINGELFGTTSIPSTKVVGVSTLNYNPGSVVRVIPQGHGQDQYREQVNITPAMQYVVMYAGDSLSIVTQDGGRTVVCITVNQMNEAQAIDHAIAHPRAPTSKRFRLIRNDGTAFITGFGSPSWRPNFVWSAASQLMTATEVDAGPIPVDIFCTYPKFERCLLRVRVANSDTDSALHVWEPVTGNSAVAQAALKNMIWSKVISVSHDDHIAVASGAPLTVNTVVCDIEVVRVEPAQGLIERFGFGG